MKVTDTCEFYKAVAQNSLMATTIGNKTFEQMMTIASKDLKYIGMLMPDDFNKK